MGLVLGTCESCGKTFWRSSLIPLVLICDCYRECPLCGGLMVPYAPDLSPRTCRDKDNSEWGPLNEAKKDEASTLTVYVCLNHKPPHYSTCLLVGVRLE